MRDSELEKRTKRLAIEVIKLVEQLPKNQVARVLGNQLLRAGTSVGANYRAACRAKSRADFLSKMGNVEEEADEARYWLESCLLKRNRWPNIRSSAFKQKVTQFLP